MSKKSRKLLEKFEQAFHNRNIVPESEEERLALDRQYKLAKANLAAHLIVLEEMAKGSF